MELGKGSKRRLLLHRQKRKALNSKPAKRAVVNVDAKSNPTTSQDSAGQSEEWLDLGTPGPVCRALSEMGFHSPTDIQRETIPVVIQGKKDIIGAAETVSLCYCV